MNQRNKQAGEDLEIKPQTQTTFSKAEFKPGKYLSSRTEHRDMKDNIGFALNE
jgi:hypothetical protein